MNHRQRGAALIETALALPVILVALYGLTWAVRAGTVSERAESAVRYAGVVSAQQNPYHDYSLYALYNNVLNSNSNVQTLDCAAPDTLYLKGGTLPVVIPGTQQNKQILPSFWQPDTLAPGCDKQKPQRQYFAGQTRSYLLLQSVPSMSTLTSDGGYFGVENFGSNPTTEYRFYRSPDLATIMHCAGGLGSTVSNSLGHIGGGAQIFALQPGDFSSTPITVSSNCTAAIGNQAPQPPPGTNTFIPGSTPPPTPGPTNSPTAQPSPSPTATPATPKPSAAPSAAASPTPASSPTSGGGTGGGGGPGGGGTPVPSPSPGKGGSPAPPCCGPPTGAPGNPTAAPSSAPVTPAPSKAPSTPKPSAKPTTTPTAKPQPTPTTQGPPGGIS